MTRTGVLGSSPDDERGEQKVIFDSVDIILSPIHSRVAYYVVERNKKDRR